MLNNGAHGEVGAILDCTVKEPADGLAVGVVGRASGPRRPEPDGQVDGHPAHPAPGLPYVHGFDVQVTASDSTLAKLDKTDGVVGRKITIYGGDPADWTTNPVE